METMKAFVAVARGTYELREVPVPQIGDDDILIQVRTGAICGSDVHIYAQEMDPLCGYPTIMGHENAGVIVKKGRNVSDKWKIGDRVTSENTIEVCGECYACSTGDYVTCEHRKGMGVGADGCFAEYVKIPGKLLNMMPNCIFRIPDNVSFEEAPLLEPAANGYKAVFQEGNLMAGECVLIAGAGALGLYSAHMASIGGASRVILMVRRSTQTTKIETAKKMGVTDVVFSDNPNDTRNEILRLTEGAGADLAIEATGSPGVLNQCLGAVRVHGRVVRISINNQPFGYGLDSLTLRSVSVIGHMGYDTISWKNTIRLAEAGKLDLRSVVTHVLPLEETKTGFEKMLSREAGKVILRVTESAP